MTPDTALPATVASPWSIVDMAVCLGLALSVVVGAWRGLITELLSLLGWAVAYMAAQWWGPQVGATVPVGAPGSRLNVLAGMMLVFVAAWVGWAVLSWAVRQIVRSSGLSGTDRLLGAFFGLGRGLLVALLVFTLVGMTPISQWAPWQQSKAVPLLQWAVQALRPVLPDEVLTRLPGV